MYWSSTCLYLLVVIKCLTHLHACIMTTYIPYMHFHYPLTPVVSYLGRRGWKQKGLQDKLPWLNPGNSVNGSSRTKSSMRVSAFQYIVHTMRMDEWWVGHINIQPKPMRDVLPLGNNWIFKCKASHGVGL